MIAEKTPVCLVSDPTRTGVVMSVSGEGSMAQYSVFIDGQFRVFFEEQIRPLVVNQTNWVDRETFRSYLTSCLINTPSAKNLYSLNSARIDYVPYQFRPALKILKADGELGLYMTAIDRQVKSKLDGKTIGIVLCRSRNDVVAEFALADLKKPIGVSTYQLGLPPPEQLRTKLQNISSRRARIARRPPRARTIRKGDKHG